MFNVLRYSNDPTAIGLRSIKMLQSCGAVMSCVEERSTNRILIGPRTLLSYDNAILQSVEATLNFLQVQTGGNSCHAGCISHLFPRQRIPWLNQIPKQNKRVSEHVNEAWGIDKRVVLLLRAAYAPGSGDIHVHFKLDQCKQNLWQRETDSPPHSTQLRGFGWATQVPADASGRK